MKIQADKRRRDHNFQIGDKVMLNAKNLKLPSMHSRKLSPKWVGPFKIIGQKHKDSFELDLDGKFQIHPVFHVNLLKPWIDNDNEEFPDRHQDPPPAVIVDDEEEFEAEAIIKKRTRYGKTQYLVKWKGYRDEDCTWEPEDNLQNAPELISRFNQKTSRRIQVISAKISQDPRWTHHKKGDEAHDNASIPNFEETSNMDEHYCNPTLADIEDQEVETFKGERNFDLVIEDTATEIRRYSVKKFVEVVSDKGENLIGYEAPNTNIYYYRPGTMMFIAMHTNECDCNMCEWMHKLPRERKRSPRHEPYQYGRRSSNSKNRPRPSSPPVKKEKSPHPGNQWKDSPTSPTPWDDMAATCNWSEDPFNPDIPRDETRELNQPRPRPEEKTTAYWRKLHYDAAQHFSKMDTISLNICVM
jgi:hypothetical protein